MGDDDLQAKFRTMYKELNEAEEKLAKKDREIEDLKRAAAGGGSGGGDSEEVKELRRKFQAMYNELGSAEGRLKEKEQELEDLKRKGGVGNEAAPSAEGQGELQRRFNQVYDELAKVEETVTQKDKEIEALKRELDAAKASAGAAGIDLVEIERLKAELKARDDEVLDLRAQAGAPGGGVDEELRLKFRKVYHELAEAEITISEKDKEISELRHGVESGGSPGAGSVPLPPPPSRPPPPGLGASDSELQKEIDRLRDELVKKDLEMEHSLKDKDLEIAELYEKLGQGGGSGNGEIGPFAGEEDKQIDILEQRIKELGTELRKKNAHIQLLKIKDASKQVGELKNKIDKLKDANLTHSREIVKLNHTLNMMSKILNNLIKKNPTLVTYTVKELGIDKNEVHRLMKR